MTASAWDKFLLLSWKNWIIQLRHPIQTIFEILVPVIVCSLLILIRGLVNVTEYTEDFRYKPFPLITLDEALKTEYGSMTLAYSPNTTILTDLVTNVAAEFDFKPAGFANAAALESNAVTNRPYASIEFDDSLMVIQKLFHLYLVVY